MKAFWYRGERGRNFGDALMPVICDRLANLRLTWAPPAEAELFGIGSIAGRIPHGFAGWVWGTGKMHETTKLSLSAARVLALRGPLTRADCGARVELLADPGLLAALLLRHPRRRGGHHHRLGVVRHYADRETDAPHAWHIDILAGVDRVIADVASCDSIMTSSLHALVLADGLGIPSMWVSHPRVMGDGFKFRDYALAFDEQVVPGTWRMAGQRTVAAKQEALLAALESVR